MLSHRASFKSEVPLAADNPIQLLTYRLLIMSIASTFTFAPAICLKYGQVNKNRLEALTEVTQDLC